MDKKNIKFWILGSILLTIAVGSTLPFLFAETRLAAVTEEFKREGLPINLRQLADKYYPPVPENLDGSGTFEAAYSLLYNNIMLDAVKKTCYDQETAPVLLAQIKKSVRSNRDFFHEMDKIRKYDYLHFNSEWDKPEKYISTGSNLRCIINAYAIKTELPIKRNDPKQAEELLKTMFHISKLATEDSFMSRHLLYENIYESVISRLERCMNTLVFSPEQLKSFEILCSEHEQYIIKQYPYLWKVLITFLLSPVGREVIEEDMKDVLSDSLFFRKIPAEYRFEYYYYSGGFMNDLASTAVAFRKAMEVPVDIYAKRAPELKKIADKDRMRENCLEPSKIAIHFYSQIIDSIAHLRCGRTACAVERFRLKYGQLPDKLEQLVPEFLPNIPIDPFDGKQLRYVHGNFKVQYEVPEPPVELEKKAPKKKEDSMFDAAPQNRDIKYKTVVSMKKGFYVYSIGFDLKDDKAENLWERRFKDIIFVVLDKEKGKK
jgi:hypothetical protein